MPAWPEPQVTPSGLIAISLLSFGSIGGLLSPSWQNPRSLPWPASNDAYIVPFRIAEPFNAQWAWVHNGNAVNGNLDIGIYDEHFNRLVSSGSTAQAGINVVQAINITDTLLPTGVYFLALAMDNIVGEVMRFDAIAVNYALFAGIGGMANAFPLPDPFVIATAPDEDIPIYGITDRWFV